MNAAMPLIPSPGEVLDALADQPSLAPRGLRARGRALGLTLGGVAAAGSATLAWGEVERRFPTVRHVRVPVPAAHGAGDLRILQISDLHLYPGQEFLVDFLTRVARTERIDLVLSTGDNFGSADGLPLVRAAYAPFRGLPGAFVLGSNDYYSPRHRNWGHYLRRDPRVDAPAVGSGAAASPAEFGTRAEPAAAVSPSPGHASDRGHEADVPDLPWRAMVEDFLAAGWVDLSNRSAVLEVPVAGSASASRSGAARAGARTGSGAGRPTEASRIQRVSLVGVDDPHLGRDRVPLPDASWADASSLRLAVTHAPYIRVLDAFTHLHPDVIVAGHTHGGQIGLPFFGAIVTNCDLPRRFAKGLHIWTAGRDAAPLHVSAGLGNSPFAPVRVATRPEVSVLHLMPV